MILSTIACMKLSINRDSCMLEVYPKSDFQSTGLSTTDCLSINVSLSLSQHHDRPTLQYYLSLQYYPSSTSMSTQLSLSGAPVKPTRNSYTREFKLKVVKYYRDPQNTIYATSKNFGVSSKCILRWARNETKIHKSSKGSKHVSHLKVGTHHIMEELLHQEFTELRRKGLKVKAFWFRTRAKQLLEELEPGTAFSFSSGWFDGFKTRFSISLRRPTNIAIRDFHHNIRRLAKRQPGDEQNDVGRYKLSHIANMDHTPLPFSFADGPTYSETGASTVWVRGGASGMDKRQCTVQLTIFADGVPRVKPLIIFHGKGMRNTLREKVNYLYTYKQ